MVVMKSLADQESGGKSHYEILAACAKSFHIVPAFLETSITLYTSFFGIFVRFTSENH